MGIHIVPAKRFDLPYLEAWLEDCAQQGLRPVWLDSVLCNMKKAKPENIRYRLEPIRKGHTPPPALLDLYAEAGWTYVCEADGFFLFASSDPLAPEPYTDQESKAQALTWLTRRIKRFSLYQLCIWLLVFATIFLLALIRPQVLPWLLLQIPPVGILWLVCFLLRNLLAWQRLKKLRKTLMAEKKPIPGKSGKGRNLFYGTVVLAWLLILAVSIVLPVKEAPLEKGLAPSLTTLETSYPVTSQGGVYQEQLGTLLVPVQYSTEEAALGEEISPDRGLPLLNGRYDPHLKMAYYRLSLPFLVPMLARAQMEMFGAINLSWTYAEGSYPEADFVLIADSQTIAQMVALGSGGELVVYSYDGAEDLSNHMDLLIQPLQ